MLFDLEKDPEQKHPYRDEKEEERFITAMIRIMKENDAPKEQYERLGLVDYQ